ncbi:polymer-forming cytoskeletal protein [Candidatus Leptofilum sp.]|uniref:polymer-forming cytoskeletal protein n=1 Tax=Candidatus Leptofilum sp. TaxID=3241576 RepID=UPI003B5C3128
MTVTEESTTPDGTLIPTDEPATEPNAEPNGQGLLDRLRFWRRGQTWLEIVGYHVEDIHTDQPVAIQEGATLVGNVFAPRLMVAGLLTGSAVCHDIRVEKSGQILGDVFTVELMVLSGGNIHGWISSVDEADYATLAENGHLPDDSNLTRNENAPDLPEGQLLNRNEAQIEALHHLQAQAAMSLAARAELEQDFQRRLTELAGESTSTIANLKQELTELRTELTTKQTQLDEAQEALRHRKSQVERQTNELGIARDLMTEQNDELTNLRQQHTQLQNSHSQLQSDKTAVDSELETAVGEINTLRDRIHSLEVAHKASLVHTSEQEESLIRWQELAEITEKKVEELEAELQKMENQAEESNSVLEMQREQRKAAETELEKVLNELTELREKSADPLAKIEQLAEANEQISQLEAELADAEHAHFERVLWYKAELEASQATATSAEKAVADQADHLTKLEAELQLQTDKVAEMQTAVTDTQADLQSKQAKWNKRHEELVEQNMGLQTVIQDQKVQLESSETELNRYLSQATAQGHHLAEIQARLVERELQLKQAIAKLKDARSMIEKQNQAIKQIQQRAGERIQNLQRQLTQTS